MNPDNSSDGINSVGGINSSDGTEDAVPFTPGVPERRASRDLNPMVGPDVVEFIDLRPEEVERRCFTLIDLDVARRMQAVPVRIEHDYVVIAMADASNLVMMDDLRLRLPGYELGFVAADLRAIEATLARWSREVARADESEAVRELVEEITMVEIEESEEAGRMAKLVATMLEQAVIAGASDVHIEPADSTLQVRFRVDGTLVAHAEYPIGLATGIINRLKVMAGMEIAERRRPLDGRFSRTFANRDIDCRIVTLPVSTGVEGAAIRLFDQSRARMSLEQVGFHTELTTRLRALLDSPHGLILATGPTGSGKTTSLYASLGIAAKPERKTITIEDPVEIRFPSITQVQVNDKAGLSFSVALRSFLRADPDVVLVGEIRDNDTAQLAAQAALTGHLVLSTLHTNEAAGAPTRLANLGLEQFVIASALRGVLAQRLLRRLCQRCARPYEPDPDELVRLRFPVDEIELPEQLLAAQGCPDCDHVGYKGRVPAGELLTVDDDIIRAIMERAPSSEIDRLARAAGQRSLRADAWLYAAEGVTSVDEVLRVGV